jgi:hypothetical protein
MNPKVISKITASGSVAVTTALSFLVRPPVLNLDELKGFNWINIFTFISGIVSLLFFTKLTSRKKIKRIVSILVILLLVLIAVYQTIYNKYSIQCVNKIRVVISHGKGQNDEIDQSIAYWMDHCNQTNPYICLMDSFRCDSTQIWSASELMPPYYSLIMLYLAIIISLTICFILVSNILRKAKK